MRTWLRIGQSGEKRAERYLRRRGYRLVTRNYQCPAGEIDLIMLDGETIVFVEVKTRSTDEHGDIREAVTPAKQKHMIRSARCFLQQTQSTGRSCRFDIATVLHHDNKHMKVEHFQAVFTPDDGD